MRAIYRVLQENVITAEEGEGAGKQVGKKGGKGHNPFPEAFQREVERKRYPSPKTKKPVKFGSLPWESQVEIYKKWKLAHHKAGQPPMENVPKPGSVPEGKAGRPRPESRRPEPSKEARSTAENLGSHVVDTFKHVAEKSNFQPEHVDALNKHVAENVSVEKAHRAAHGYHENAEKHGHLYAAFNLLRDLGALSVRGVRGVAKKMYHAIQRKAKGRTANTQGNAYADLMSTLTAAELRMLTIEDFNDEYDFPVSEDYGSGYSVLAEPDSPPQEVPEVDDESDDKVAIFDGDNGRKNDQQGKGSRWKRTTYSPLSS